MEESRERSASEEFADGGRMLWTYRLIFRELICKSHTSGENPIDKDPINFKQSPKKHNL